MKHSARLIALLLVLLLCAGTTMAATAEETTLLQQLLPLLKQFGYESVDEALEAFGLETQEELIALARSLLSTITAPATTDDIEPPPTEEERSFDGKVLATMEMEASAEEILYFFTVQLGIPIADFVCFPTISEALFALKTGKVDTLLSMDASATYMAKQDDTLYTYIDPRLEDFN